MMSHFNAFEQLYAFVFHICDFDNYALCDCCWNRSKVINICNDSVNFEHFNAEHMKHDNQNHKYGIENVYHIGPILDDRLKEKIMKP